MQSDTRDGKRLIPLFVPPLAQLLAAAERNASVPLTREQVEAIRDESACIMMESGDFDKMTQSRGYVDVNPESCWADWHRLRVEMTGKGFLPKIILCIPGDDHFRSKSEQFLRSLKIAHEFRQHDPHLRNAFRISSATASSLTEHELTQIANHKTVLYVQSENFVAAAAPATGRAFLKLGRQLLEAGGFAIKCESSGISHSVAHWAQLDGLANRDLDAQWSALIRAYVVFLVGSRSDLYSCGMHLLGTPDAIVSEAVIQNSLRQEQSVVDVTAQLFRIFAMYLVSECKVGAFSSGHTFSIDQGSPRYRVIWEPCVGYAEDDFFFNPFGRWRFTLP